MRAFLIPMAPKQIRLLIGGKISKVVKVNCPRGSVPFKCYVYCPSRKYQTKRAHNKAMNESGNEYSEWCGKVVAEFVSTEIKPVMQLPPLKFFEETQMGIAEYETLLSKGRSKMRVINVNDLIVYGKPKELREFRKPDGEPFDQVIGAFTPVFVPVEEK